MPEESTGPVPSGPSNEPHRRRWHGVCPASAPLTELEQELNRAYPDGHLAPDRAPCRLPVGHPGQHAASVTRGRRQDVERWLRWSGLDREWFDAKDCGVVSEEYEYGSGEPDVCHLFESHPGPHSFTYYPPESWLYLDDD